VLERAPHLTTVEHVRFVLFDDETRRVHEEVLEELVGEISE